MKTALVTGASSGIGKELARIHAKNGGDLVIVARSKDKLDQLKKELEDTYRVNVMVITCDLSKQEAAQEIYNQVKEANLEIEYLFNNAGFGGQGYFHERDIKDDLAMINVNVYTLTFLTNLFLKDMVQRNSGRILNTASTAALCPGPLQAVYYATKAYVSSFSNALWSELDETNITVTALLPGATETEFAATSGMDKTSLFKNTVSPASVAQDGYHAMMEGKLEVISGMNRAIVSSLKVIPRKRVLKMIKANQQVKK